MSPVLRKAIQNVALALVVGGAGTGVALAWRRYGGVDPYGGIKKPPVDNGAAFTASGVKVRQYKDGKLVATANAASMSMPADRNSLNLQKITKGSMQTTKGKVGFEAGTGVMRPNLKMVDVSNGVSIRGTGFDFKTSQASIDGKQGQITMPKPLGGHIGDGQFTAASLVYAPNSDYASLNKVVWRGHPPKGMDVPGATPQSRTWNMVAENVTSKNGTRTGLDARAEDGEMIVMAPKVVQDVKTDVLTATGRATYRSAKADIVADKVVVYRREKRAVFTGNVVMLLRPKKDWDKPLPKNDEPAKKDDGAKPLSPKLPPELAAKGGPSEDPISPQEKQRDEALRSGKTLHDYPTNLKAEEVTYWYGEGNRHAIAKGGDPTALQTFDDGRWREMKAPEAHYDGEKELLDLLSEGPKIQVKYKNSIGDWGTANWMQMSTKEDATEDDENITSRKANIHYIDRDGSDDPRGAPKPADKKTTPPPAKTEPPPVKTGP